MKCRFLTYSCALALILLMTWLAENLGENEIIFPEILALAVGGWVAEKRPWRTSALNLWLSPTLAALFGVLLMRYCPAPLWARVGMAFVFVTLLLQVTRSTLVPSISAAILPILIGTTSWIYPLSVCVLTAVIAIHTPLIDRLLRQPSPPPPTPLKPFSLGRELVFHGKLLFIVLAVTFLAMKSHCIFLIAPPLIVTLVEFSHDGSPLRKSPVKVFFLLGFAAGTGVLCHSILALHLGWSLWLSSGLTTLALFFAYEFADMLFPPAAAIALLPTILPPEQIFHYPWQVMAGTALFLTVSLLFFRPLPQRKKEVDRLPC